MQYDDSLKATFHTCTAYMSMHRFQLQVKSRSGDFVWILFKLYSVKAEKSNSCASVQTMWISGAFSIFSKIFTPPSHKYGPCVSFWRPRTRVGEYHEAPPARHHSRPFLWLRFAQTSQVSMIAAVSSFSSWFTTLVVGIAAVVQQSRFLEKLF